MTVTQTSVRSVSISSFVSPSLSPAESPLPSTSASAVPVIGATPSFATHAPQPSPNHIAVAATAWTVDGAVPTGTAIPVSTAVSLVSVVTVNGVNVSAVTSFTGLHCRWTIAAADASDVFVDVTNVTVSADAVVDSLTLYLGPQSLTPRRRYRFSLVVTLSLSPAPDVVASQSVFLTTASIPSNGTVSVVHDGPAVFGLTRCVLRCVII